MTEARRCGLCRKQPAIEHHHVCGSCLPNVPKRKPIEETLALIDATLAATQETP